MTGPLTRRRWLRVTGLALIALVILTCAAAGWIWLQREELAASAIQRTLGRLNVEQAELRVTQFGLTGATVEAVSLSDGALTAQRIDLEYTLRTMVGGRVGTIRIVDLAATIETGDDGVRIQGLPPGLWSNDASPAADREPALPFERIVLENARIAIHTPGYPDTIDVAMDGLLARGEGADIEGRLAGSTRAQDLAARFALQDVHLRLGETVAIRGDLEIEGHWRDVDAALGATAEIEQQSDGSFDITLESHHGRISTPDIDLSGIETDARIRMGNSELEVSAIVAVDAGSYADQAFGPLRLSGRYDGVDLVVDGTATAETGHVTFSLMPGSDETHLPYTLDVLARIETAPALAAAGMAGEAIGTIELDAGFGLPRPEELAAAPLESLTTIEGRGMLALTIDRMVLPDYGAVRNASATFDLLVEGGFLSIRSDDKVQLTVTQLAPGIQTPLPAEIRPIAEPPLSLALTAADETALVMRVALPPAPPVARLEGRMIVENDAGRTVLDVIGLEARRTTPLITGLTADRLRISLPSVSMQGSRFQGDLILAGLISGPDGLVARIEFDGEFDGQRPDDIRADGRIKLEGRLEFDPAETAATIILFPESRAVIDRLETGNLRLVDGLVISPAEPSRGHLSAAGRGSAGIVTGPVNARFRLLDDGEASTDVDVGLQRLALDLDGDTVRVVLNDGTARLTGADVALGGIHAEARFVRGLPHDGRLSIRSLAHTGEIPLFVPLMLEGTFTRDGGLIAFEATLADHSRLFEMGIDGRHHLSAGRGYFDASFDEVLLVPDVLQPDHILPLLRGIRSEVDGTISGMATASWGPGGLLDSHARFGLDLSKLVVGEIIAENIDATIRLSGLLPPTTPGAQIIRVDLLDIGVPLQSGVIAVTMTPDSLIHLELRQFLLFGGRILTDPIVLDPQNPEWSATLNVYDVDLEEMLRFADFGELNATGRVTGVIPVSFDRGEVRIDRGRLSTVTGGGVIEYRPAGVDVAFHEANEATDVLMAVLNRFLYEEVTMTIDEVGPDQMRIALGLRGRSATFSPEPGITFENVPVNLNVHIEGPLRDIMNRQLEIMQITSQIPDQ